MKTISLILTFIGLVLCFAGSVGVQILLRQTLNAMMNSETGGIGAIASGFENTFMANYLAIFGCMLVLLGLLLGVISMFTGRKQQAI